MQEHFLFIIVSGHVHLSVLRQGLQASLVAAQARENETRRPTCHHGPTVSGGCESDTVQAKPFLRIHSNFGAEGEEGR